MFAALLIGLAAVLDGAGIWTLSSFFFGPFWQHASAPGLAMFAIFTGVGLTYSCFGRLLLLPPLVDRLGAWLGVPLVVLVTGLVFFTPLTLVPVPGR